MVPVHVHVPYSRKLLREKTFTNFAIFQPSAKEFSPRNSRHANTHYATNFSIPWKFSPRNAPFLPIHENVLLPLYGISYTCFWSRACTCTTCNSVKRCLVPSFWVSVSCWWPLWQFPRPPSPVRESRPRGQGGLRQRGRGTGTTGPG